MSAALTRLLRSLGWSAVACGILACSKSADTQQGQTQSGGGQSSGGAVSGGGNGSGNGAGVGGGGATTQGGTTGGGGVTGSAGSAGTATSGAGGSVVVGPSLGPADFAAGELNPPSLGATITMQNIGATGSYPSRRESASGMCDAVNTASCCMTQHDLPTDALSPWNEELILTLRGPILFKQIAVYQPDAAATGSWVMTSAWDSRTPDDASGIHFEVSGSSPGNEFPAGSFPGWVGSECLVDAMPDAVYPCGAGSVPYCPDDAGTKYYGWEGSKMFVMLAGMPRVGAPLLAPVTHCQGDGGWYDAPWIGLSHGELIRSGAFGGCHCYAQNPDEWWLGDGCGQFNVFEVVNDNNEYANFNLFSTNLFAYHGYVGEGPCGQTCDISGLAADVDLVNKSNSGPAAAGAIITPAMGPGAAFRRPESGYRYFIVLMDVASRSIQLAVVHPQAVPPALAGLLPALPLTLDGATITSALDLRLPQ